MGIGGNEGIGPGGGDAAGGSGGKKDQKNTPPYANGMGG